MTFDPRVLLDLPHMESRQTISPFRIMLYALGLGANELPFVYENGLKALPTMAAILAYPGGILRDPALGITRRKMLHVETSLILHAPLPLEGELTGRTTFGPIFDKGRDKGTIVYLTLDLVHEDGMHIATVRSGIYLRGDGGHGGSPGKQPPPNAVPDRAADAFLALETREDQALLYRLASGDMNPLHADPDAARSAGFPRPILHGLATYGVAGRALLRLLADNDPARIRRIDARFSAPVFPGETIETAIWHEGAGRAAFRCRVVERDTVVLNNGYVEYS